MSNQKKKQIKPKPSRRKKIRKLQWKQNRKIIEKKISETQNWFFVEINKM